MRSRHRHQQFACTDRLAVFERTLAAGRSYSVHVDRLGIGGGNDTFVFNAGEGDGDTIVDFAGNGAAAAGDSLQFIGYGPGATFTNIDATHWQVNYSGGSSHEIITFSNGASIGATDFVFV